MKIKMNMKKKMLTMLSVFLLGSSIAGGSVFASEATIATQDYDLEGIECEIEGNYFEDMKDYIDKEVKAENKKEALKLLTDIEKLENEEKFDEAAKLWDKFEKLLPDVEGEMDYDFYGEIKDFINKEVKAENKKEALNLLSELEKLEKNEKFDEADKVWDKLEKLLPECEGIECDLDVYDEDMDNYYDDLKELLAPEIKAEDKDAAMKLIEEIQTLEEAEKYDEADKVWEKLEKYLPSMEVDLDEDFDDEAFYKDIRSFIEKEAKDSTTKDKALKIFDDIEKLEKNGKYDDADKKWDELDELVPFDIEEIQ